MGEAPARRPGRPSGPSRTRETILAVAREEFAERGFEAATIRRIAGRAGVDPAMIAHHFGSKRQLFLAVLDVPVDPAAEIAQVVAGPPEELAVRLVGRMLSVWDSPAGSAAVAALRVALQGDVTTGLLRDFAMTQALRPLMEVMPGSPEERLWRGNLAASQMIGLVIARYVLRLEPLASAAHPEVVAAVAPTLQRYLLGPLSREPQ